MWGGGCVGAGVASPACLRLGGHGWGGGAGVGQRGGVGELLLPAEYARPMLDGL